MTHLLPSIVPNHNPHFMWHYIIPTVAKTSLIINKYSNKMMIMIMIITTDECTAASMFVNYNVLNFDLSL
jgi:hypothetical protein